MRSWAKGFPKGPKAPKRQEVGVREFQLVVLLKLPVFNSINQVSDCARTSKPEAMLQDARALFVHRK